LFPFSSFSPPHLVRSPTLPCCAQLIGASCLSVIATSPELRRRRPPPPLSISSSLRSHLDPQLAQPHSAAPHSFGQASSSHAPCITAVRFPILRPPFAVGSARSVEMPPPPSSSVGATLSPGDSSHGTRPSSPPQTLP
jgi:hypothetical protein